MAQQPDQLQLAHLQAISKKVFSRSSDDAPAPEYASNVEFTAVGMDIIMDVGTVSPESIRVAVESGEKPPTVRFNVDARYGMSIQTAAVMLQRLGQLLQAAAAQGQAQASQEASATHVKEGSPAKDA